MEVYLIRHGESMQPSLEYFCEKTQATNPPLTQNGIKQAHKLAQRLKHVAFDRIYASDLDRAMQTANILADPVDAGIEICKQFREIHMGELEKKSWDKFPALYSKWALHEEDIAYPNGENGADVWRRCKRKLDEIASMGYDRIAVVCHGGTIRSIICGILGIPQYKRFSFGAPLENCSVSVITYKEKSSVLHAFNDFSHIKRS